MTADAAAGKRLAGMCETIEIFVESIVENTEAEMMSAEGGSTREVLVLFEEDLF